jgi:hypothetical protein
VSLKKKEIPFRLPRWIAVAVLAAGTSRAAAQSVDWSQSQGISPFGRQWPRFTSLNYDMEYEQDIFSSPGAHIVTDRIYIFPSVGVAWQSYLYHPDLLAYGFQFEPGYIWEKSGSPGAMSVTEQLALNGDFRADLLRQKPYATLLSYSSSYQQVNYDFFNTALVDSKDWGVTSGYREGPVPVNVGFNQSYVNSTSPGQTSDTVQSTVTLDAKNQRSMDDLTHLNYQFGQFNRQNTTAGVGFTDDNNYNLVTLTDLEHYQKSIWRTSLLFNQINTLNTFSSSDLNALTDYDIELTPNLHNIYDYAFSWYDDSLSDSIQNTATASLHHQLYDSLASGVQVEGSTLNSSSGESTLDSYSVQTTGTADYTKRLGSWGRLTIGETLSYTATDQVTSGPQTTINNESHLVPNTGLVMLDQPNTLAVIQVTDSRGIPLPPTDYIVIQTTNPWQIQIIFGGLNPIVPGSTILVTYTVKSNPTGAYSTLGNQSKVTLSFLHDMADVYVGYNLTQNQASSPDFVLQDERQFQAGADFHWRGLSLSANYINTVSTLYNSTAYNLGENYSINPSARTRVGVSLTQQWDYYTYTTALPGNENQYSTFYNFMVFCDWRPTTHLSWNNEAGLQRAIGSQINQNFLAVRTYLNWNIGKLEVHLGYSYEGQKFTSQKSTSNYAFIRFRRYF